MSIFATANIARARKQGASRSDPSLCPRPVSVKVPVRHAFVVAIEPHKAQILLPRIFPTLVAKMKPIRRPKRVGTCCPGSRKRRFAHQWQSNKSRTRLSSQKRSASIRRRHGILSLHGQRARGRSNNGDECDTLLVSQCREAARNQRLPIGKRSKLNNREILWAP